MAYITQTDVENAVGTALLSQLFSDGVGGVSSALVDEAMLDAEGDANSILGPSFVVPVVGPVARILSRCCVDLTIFYGYERKPEFRISGGDNPEQKRYDRAQKQLKDLKSGERDMGNETPEAKSALTGGVVYSSNSQFITDDTEGTADGPSGYY